MESPFKKSFTTDPLRLVRGVIRHTLEQLLPRRTFLDCVHAAQRELSNTNLRATPLSALLSSHFWDSIIPKQPARNLSDGFSEPTLGQHIADHLSAMHSSLGGYVFAEDNDYPDQLRHIHRPPSALTYLGNRSALQNRAVSLVGARKATPHALRESTNLGRILQYSGFTTVSGGALGCDAAAHTGVIRQHLDVDVRGVSLDLKDKSDEPCRGICVFAGGLGKMYPKQNERIFRYLSNHGGLLLSERLWNCPSKPRDFVIRNRIIAGLSPICVILQAGKRSGAMTTANLALDSGRDVFILDHPEDIRTMGSLALGKAGGMCFPDAIAIANAIRSTYENTSTHSVRTPIVFKPGVGREP